MCKYVKLFANCIPVKGYAQSILIDLQRGSSSNFIPNSLFDILIKYSDKSICEIKNEFNNEFDDIIDDYFAFLLKNEFAFKHSKQELKHFPKLDLIWKTPSLIENAIVDISVFEENKMKQIIIDLSKLRCNALQIRFSNALSLNNLEIIGNLLKSTRILSVEFFIKYSAEVTLESLILLANKYPRFQKIYIYNSPQKEISSCSRLVFLEKSINLSKDCGAISSEYFAINIQTFTESQHYNTCLNRKISIDVNGEIKNCPSMKKSFGNWQTGLSTTLMML